MNYQKFYTLEDLADMFGFSRAKASALNKSDGWPGLKFGKQFRFSEDDLKAILSIYEKQPQPKERRPRIGTRSRSK